MIPFKKIALVAALALAGSTAAHAATESGSSYFLMDSGAMGDFTDSWSFSNDSFYGQVSPDGVTYTGTKGDSFVDLIVFNVVNPDEYIQFTVGPEVDLVTGAVDPLVGFDAFLLAPLGGDPIDIEPAFSTNALSMAGGTYQLAQGVYELDLVGSFTHSGGLYAGTIVGTVPEPTNIALMAAGLGVMGFVARRRGAKKA